MLSEAVYCFLMLARTNFNLQVVISLIVFPAFFNHKLFFLANKNVWMVILDQIAYPSYYFAHRSEEQVSKGMNESRGKHSKTFLEP